MARRDLMTSTGHVAMAKQLIIGAYDEQQKNRLVLGIDPAGSDPGIIVTSHKEGDRLVVDSVEELKDEG